MKKEKSFTMKLGDYTTVAQEIEAGAYTPHIQKIMDEITADIHRAMFIGMDLGTSDMTATTIVANESALTIADLERAMDIRLLNSPPLPRAPEVKVKAEPKSEFKSWPYGID
jgi:hypothetical protein